MEKAPYGHVAINGKLRKVKAMYQTLGGNRVEFVPVVRCKDCKHRGDHEVCPLHDIRLCFDGDGHMDEVEDDKTEDEFFCSYGERKGR